MARSPSSGALVDRDRLARIERVGALVAGPELGRREVDLGLSTRDSLGAWSWRNGRVRLSSSLVDLLDEDELAAAIAHELGHLYDGGHLHDGPAALHGGSATGAESRADRIGCTLLARRGLPGDAMSRMLAKVARALSAEGEPGPGPSLTARAAALAVDCADVAPLREVGPSS